MQSDELGSHGSSPLVDVSRRLNPIRGISPHTSMKRSSALAESCQTKPCDDDEDVVLEAEEEEEYMSTEDMEDVFSTHPSSQ